ncbi:probable dolichyl pyrophosphate Man9GlcNAc2 alpha-1,3-glucosyltransferase [Drosophila hydei]|uniref:Alpha-1,3-glucosyltransferase n=1 Tax=Drosophila hydei TaxID=7224 RepID=A0A6J1LP84_DROHY|nr:probable dolichyl pyrophosphate Man9GlcNAc2 alpha-1,3-glucosyltransferase [Drosophila hydei]
MSNMSSELIATLFVAISLRSIISMNSYSGFNKPPMFGDYEAQRHWQEITVNLEVKQWYTNSTHNDLQYWGLDYPPLTAYHSYLLGRAAERLNPRYVELNKSRGFESKDHKSYMRFTVLVADALVFIPAILALSVSMDRIYKKNLKLQLQLLFAIYPGQALIDNGHFQYNNISLGLAVLAVAGLLCDMIYVAAFAFTLALNYKQMELYHALPFFAYLLSTSLSQKSAKSAVKELSIIATIVLSTFAILWYPWSSSIDATSDVLLRLFPVKRGVFEDKVANFWCSINVVYKLKKHFSDHKMALICFGTTLLTALPINVHLFFRRSKYIFILSLFNTAASFFLFSFQVHEKTILLLTLPSICLFYWWPKEMLWFLKLSVFSMIPLFKRDNLLVPTVGLMIIFNLTFKSRYFKSNENEICHRKLKISITQISEILMIAIFLAFISIEPPSRFPDIWPLIICIISCAHISMFLIWGYTKQFT